MKTVVCFKSVYDDVQIRTNSDKTLDCSSAAHVASLYDLNAIEAAALQRESDPEGTLIALTCGPTSCDDSTMRKNVAARAVDEVHMVLDDRLEEAETNSTASTLSAALDTIGDVDLIICGDGSADMYAHQVGIQLGEMRHIPNVNAVKSFTVDGSVVHVDRELEDIVEHIDVTMPCVLSVLSDIAQPRILKVMDIMGAGRKPVVTYTLDDLGVTVPEPRYSIESTKVPEPAPRKHTFFGSSDADIDEFIQTIARYLETEGA